jgi:hypothetical protein
MSKRKTMIYKILDRRLNIEQQKFPLKTGGELGCSGRGKQFLQ